ncbi:MAG: hypothetical protein ACC707_04270 [Thiohalomonadales bacterium]
MKMKKTEQLQIRLSPKEKARIKRAARRANLPMSDWVLSRLLPDGQQKFHSLVVRINRAQTTRFPLASLNDFLAQLTADEFDDALQEKPSLPDDEYMANYIAAMIEVTAHKNGVAAPNWLAGIRPLNRPRFASNLKSLRRHLLIHSPPPFRNRNIFIDSTVGDRL